MMTLSKRSPWTVNGKAADQYTIARIERASLAAKPTAKPVRTTQVVIDEEYEQWKKEHGLDQPLSAEEVALIAAYELKYIA